MRECKLIDMLRFVCFVGNPMVIQGFPNENESKRHSFSSLSLYLVDWSRVILSTPRISIPIRFSHVQIAISREN